jgi:hypothetical protein
MARNTHKTAPRAPKSSKPVETAPVVETVTIEAPAIEAPAPSTAPIEAPAPVASETPAPSTEKVVWADVMKKAQASFAKTGAFREGTNRAVLYPLLCRDEGMSLHEAVDAIAKAGRVRKLNTVQTDLHDIAAITTRKLVRHRLAGDAEGTKRYKLAPLAPVAPIVEEAK